MVGVFINSKFGWLSSGKDLVFFVWILRDVEKYKKGNE